MNQYFTNFFAVLITICVLILWVIPAYMIYHGFGDGWYLVIVAAFVITIMWGLVIANKYFDWR